MSRFFINCEDASILSTRDQYNDLNPKERFRHKLHKSHCLGCRGFANKNRIFTKKLNKLSWVCLSKSQKSDIRKHLLQAMGKK